MYDDTDNQVGKGETVRDNQDHGLNNFHAVWEKTSDLHIPVEPGCTDQAGGDDQEGAGGLGPNNGSDLERGQRGQISLHWEHLHGRSEFHSGKMATGQPGEMRAGWLLLHLVAGRTSACAETALHYGAGHSREDLSTVIDKGGNFF